MLKQKKYLLLALSSILLLKPSLLSQTQSHSGLIPEYLPQIQIDSIEYFGSKQSTRILEPIGSFQSLAQCFPYPEIARRAHIGGYVTVKLHINTNGEVDNSEIVSIDHELFLHGSLDGVKRIKFHPLPDLDKSGCEAIVHIKYSVINLERVSITTRRWVEPYTLTIHNDGQCFCTTRNQAGELDTLSDLIQSQTRINVLTALRDEILMIRHITPVFKDSSIVITYVENGQSETISGYVEGHHFWAIDAIARKIIGELSKAAEQRKLFFH
jgi:TonB family protein